MLCVTEVFNKKGHDVFTIKYAPIKDSQTPMRFKLLKVFNIKKK